MAQPSSERQHRSERERDRDRDRSHRHHRTISSTTLLLVLSLVLAVLAVMLSLPSSQSAASSEAGSSGVLGYLTPKRTQALIARESAVAVREAEVARREAELLAGAPGGVIPSPSPILCPPCAATTTIETITAPAQTIIKEVVKEDSLTPPGWVGTRTEELLDRELKIAERERDISKREESVNRREHDASRRESWIMEQLQYVSPVLLFTPVSLVVCSVLLATTLPMSKMNIFTNLWNQSEKPRYRHPSRAALSFETKEIPVSIPSPYESVMPLHSFVRAWGTTVLLSCPPCPLCGAADQSDHRSIGRSRLDST
jgi:hypothetical protein